MIPAELKDFFVPGSVPFLLLSLIPGGPAAVPKEGWRTDGQDPGSPLSFSSIGFSARQSQPSRWSICSRRLCIPLCRRLTPAVRRLSWCSAPECKCIESRGASYGAPTREGSLRVLEAVRLHRLLGGAPIIATGGVRSSPYSESALMAHQLEQLGVPADKIIKEEKSTNTRDHALFVPPLLKQHGIERFVLVTSQQHIARALGVFRKVGFDPVPSTPEVYVGQRSLSREVLAVARGPVRQRVADLRPPGARVLPHTRMGVARYLHW